MPARAKPRDLERFLHDEVAQQLSGIGLQLDLLRLDMQTDTPEMVSRTVVIQQTLDGVLAGIRRFLSEHHCQPSAVGGRKRVQRSN
jgi:signal transduction histidine kinase